MSDRYDNAEPPPGWRPEKRKCPFCLVMNCGCPDEPEPFEPHIIRGTE